MIRKLKNTYNAIINEKKAEKALRSILHELIPGYDMDFMRYFGLYLVFIGVQDIEKPPDFNKRFAEMVNERLDVNMRVHVMDKSALARSRAEYKFEPALAMIHSEVICSQ